MNKPCLVANGRQFRSQAAGRPAPGTEPPENWWTRPAGDADTRTAGEICASRIRYYLSLYVDLRRACYLDCALEAQGAPSTGRRPQWTSPRWTDLAAIKADLDRALARLPRSAARVVLLYYAADLSLAEVGRRLGGLKRRRTRRLLDAAVEQMVRILAPEA